MKIRILGQSLRLRLGQSEVRALAAGRVVDETIVFGPALSFGCALRADPDVTVVRIATEAGRVTVRLPASQIDDWAGTDAVGISAELEVENGRALRLLIEKDFECLDNESGESQADAFPNPSPNPSAAC